MTDRHRKPAAFRLDDPDVVLAPGAGEAENRPRTAGARGSPCSGRRSTGRRDRCRTPAPSAARNVWPELLVVVVS